MTTTTTFRVKDSTGWKSDYGFKTLKEAIKYAKKLITDESWLEAKRFYIEVIRIKRIDSIKTSADEITIKDVIFYTRNENKWKSSKNYKVVKF